MTSLYRNPPYDRQRSITMFRQTQLYSGLSLLGGLGVGAALVYLLDSQQGAHRRSALRRSAAGGMAAAGAALLQGVDRLRQGAAHAGSSAANLISRSRNNSRAYPL